MGKKDEIIAMLHEMGESEKDYEIVDFDGEELDAAKLTCSWCGKERPTSP